MPWAPQGLPRIAEWRRKIGCPLVAIGGITLERAPVLAAGADSVAVITDIVTSQDPEERTKTGLPPPRRGGIYPQDVHRAELARCVLDREPLPEDHPSGAVASEARGVDELRLDPAIPMSEALRRVAFAELDIAHGALSTPPTAKAASTAPANA